MSVDDVTLAVEAGPKGTSIFLSDVAAFFRGELRGGGGDLGVPRFLAKLLEIAFAEAASRVDALEEADRALRRELAIARADVAQLEQKLVLLPLPTFGICRPATPRRDPEPGRGRLVDFGPILERMRRPTDGGPT